MITVLPSAAEVKAALGPLSNKQLAELGKLSGVPFTTLWKIRAADVTTNPGIDTVRKFLPHIDAVRTQQAA